MKLLYMGSPAAAVVPLEFLLGCQAETGAKVVAVVSQAARPVGRRQILQDPPVAAFAKERGLETLQPEKARDHDFLARVRSLEPDLAVTVAYGQILPEAFLAIPRYGTINLHPSLLPRYRGATPVPAALLAGDKRTGITILYTVKELDAGNIIAQRAVDILPDERSDQLLRRLFELGSELLPEVLREARAGIKGVPQSTEALSFCKKINKNNGLIDWAWPAAEVHNRFRAFYPWPGSFTYWQGKRCSILDMVKGEGDGLSATLGAGEFDYLKARKLLAVGCGQGELIFIRGLQLEGAKVLDAQSFWNGLKARSKLVFGRAAG